MNYYYISQKSNIKYLFCQSIGDGTEDRPNKACSLTGKTDIQEVRVQTNLRRFMSGIPLSSRVGRRLKITNAAHCSKPIHRNNYMHSIK